MAPGIRNSRVGLRGRAHFLSLRQEDLRKIRESYPHYDYLVTENHALSGFRMLYSNASFAIYDISENEKRGFYRIIFRGWPFIPVWN